MRSRWECVVPLGPRAQKSSLSSPTSSNARQAPMSHRIEPPQAALPMLKERALHSRRRLTAVVSAARACDGCSTERIFSNEGRPVEGRHEPFAAVSRDSRGRQRGAGDLRVVSASAVEGVMP